MKKRLREIAPAGLAKVRGGTTGGASSDITIKGSDITIKGSGVYIEIGDISGESR
jgi:hypothetical protein